MSAAECQVLYSDPPDCPARSVMRFRLLYGGDLLKSAARKHRVWEKHSIRRHFHSQIKRLWETNAALRYYADKVVEDRSGSASIPFLHQLSKTYAKAGQGFIPLLTSANGLVCELDILFLRQPGPGEEKSYPGDIDNRMKLLLDALRVPKDGTQMFRKVEDEPDPDPMYCLLGDDSLITGLKVTTDTLLMAGEQQSEEAVVVITVDTAQIDPFGSPWELHL